MRILALDLFRGLAVAMMIVLDAPPDRVYPIMQHAAWEGMTITDTPFPAFVFAMGASAAVSMSKREPPLLKILRRAVILFVLGLFLNALPYIISGGEFQLRVFGILQRFALVYALGMILVRKIRSDAGILAVAFGLLFVTSLGFHVYSPSAPFDEVANISSAVDFLVPGMEHIYTPTHDPEGLYGTMAATTSMLFGFLSGRILTGTAPLRDKSLLLLVAGILCLAAGGIWSLSDIIAKKIWTAPYALLNAGIDMILLAGLMILSKRTENFGGALRALGKNPLFFFVASNVALILLYTFTVSGMPIWIWIFHSTIRGLISVEFSSTVFCLIWLTIWIRLARFIERRGIIIKI